MAMHPLLKQFYNSKEWLTFREIVITERSIRDGGPTCEYCHKKARRKELTVHHEIQLTPENVNDVQISLNPDNVKVVHSHPCHDAIHKRFGFRKAYAHNVYLVYGPPCSGKSTFVIDNMEYGDIVVDINRLFSAVTLLPDYDKPNILLPIVSGIHNLLLDNIKTRYGRWENAWVIGGYADKYKRERLITELGADPIFMDISREECLRRLANDDERKSRLDEWTEYIDKWFDTYSP